MTVTEYAVFSSSPSVKSHIDFISVPFGTITFRILFLVDTPSTLISADPRE